MNLSLLNGGALLRLSCFFAFVAGRHLQEKAKETRPSLCATTDLLTTPSYDVVISPQYDGDNITSLCVSLGFSPTSCDTQPVLTSIIEVANTPGLSILPGSILAWDDLGNFTILETRNYAGGMVLGMWNSNRRLEGRVIVSYVAMPHYVDEQSRNGPSLDFRLESGGVFTSGMALLMVPPDQHLSYEVTVKWDTTAAPQGFRAVWTYGESRNLIKRHLTATELQWTFFAAGPLSSYVDEEQDRGLGRFNVYWIDEPPFPVWQMSEELGQLFDKMSAFFMDKDDVYRIFLRHNPFPGTNTGTALQRSFAFGYDDTEFSSPSPFIDRLLVLAHEMVHNWVIFDIEADLRGENWFPEGLAEFYSIELAYRYGMISRADYVNQINKRVVAYYTSPFVATSLDEANKYTWKSTSAQRLPYRRGHVFGILLDSLIRERTQSAASLDDAVLYIISRKSKGLSAGPDDFRQKVGQLIGDNTYADELFFKLTSGSDLLTPSKDSLALMHPELPVSLRRRDCEKFDLGFDESAAQNNHVIQDLKPESRAAKAGLREGDRIKQSLTVSASEMDIDKSIEALVQHTGSDDWQVIKIWPRSFDEVESWQFEWESSGGEL
ncbi:hypothetical protein G7054_g10826 [Neopestalotiopsis clavispora]|nr:hypothetical protein G7054_g10826 [Neopestalotiopsis clavispora]